jgi:peptidoglycan/LPS O-acetylase OafA/YrhL
LWPFLARRYARITLPMMVAIGLARPLKLELHFFQQSILWTLFAELIYYSLYPVLRHCWRVVGWKLTLSFAFALALGALSVEPAALDYDAFGNSLSWLLGLPVWLLGCLLAEKIHDQPAREISSRTIWSWRLGLWAAASAASALRFHSPIGYPWTLMIFSVPVFGWLRCEINYFRAHSPWGWLEWAGQWSYSVYLTHGIAKVSLLLWFPVRRGVAMDWCVLIAWVLVVAFVFYLLVEKPSHHFARWFAGKFRVTPATRA